MSDRWAFIRTLIPMLRKKPVLAWAGAFAVCLVFILVNRNSIRSAGGNAEEFEAGMVAVRDVIAEHAVSYRDEQATEIRVEAQEQLVPAVFNFSYKATEELRSRWTRFAAFIGNYPGNEVFSASFKSSVLSEFSGDFSGDISEALDMLSESRERPEILADSSAVLDVLLERGIYSIPEPEPERLNLGVVELIRQSGARIEQEMVPLRSAITTEETARAVETYVAAGTYNPAFVEIAPEFLGFFLGENVFYSANDTAQRVAEAGAKTEPVMRIIEQGKRIIKKGFVITEAEMEELDALKMALPRNNASTIVADVLFLLFVFSLLGYFCGSRVIGRNLTDSESYLVAALSALYIVIAIMFKNFSLAESMPSAVLLPTALVMMLPAILIHARLALILALALPLGAFLTGAFDTPSYIFALVSGVVAAYSLQKAEKRMDLVKAGLLIAAANTAAMLAILLWQRSDAGVFPGSLFWAAFNGAASGMLVLGVLSPLEHALNAATAFRLIELSDLNTPILRALFTVAPGTYSHSIMVANLAEAACQDIEADPLLARVGAYYHDIGKMENPDYFVENQQNSNPHDTMAPRLSATVIRSHVKLGVEKARQLGLPREVIDIISEHHGNSVITWFYSKALKQEGGDPKKGVVNIEDFSYPGSPPRSRESAVVMLADMAEAAVRSLDKPTAVKIEKFIQELISQKVEHGQLAQSELTFRDTETIKKAFVRVLMSYYHSRIEYPKIDEQTNSKPVSRTETGATSKAEHAAPVPAAAEA